MDSCEQIWSPFLKRDIAELGKVWRRALQVVRGLVPLPCEERLKSLLGPLCLEKGGTIEAYKLMDGKESSSSLSPNARP